MKLKYPLISGPSKRRHCTGLKPTRRSAFILILAYCPLQIACRFLTFHLSIIVLHHVSLSYRGTVFYNLFKVKLL
uniref:Uncharacterized protein n=1 Tax=Pararge aegeria TaxID=116150 RepID=S4NUJ4_9NEOP